MRISDWSSDVCSSDLLAPPFNTAIVRGYNALTGAKVKLGRWDEYLAMRRGILELNAAHRRWLSNDLGAIADFLFDVGKGRVPLTPAGDNAYARAEAAPDLAPVRADAAVVGPRACAQDMEHETRRNPGWARYP